MRYQLRPDMTVAEATDLAEKCGGFTAQTAGGTVIYLNGEVVLPGDWIVPDGNDYRVEAA